jgi:hypothetical protein
MVAVVCGLMLVVDAGRGEELRTSTVRHA